MPQKAIETLITDDVVETLGNVAPPVYPVTLIVYDPVQRKPATANGHTYVVIGDSVRQPDDVTPAGWMGWVLTVEVTCCILQDDTSTTPIRQLVGEYAQSVIRALLVDTSRGAHAEDTIPTGIFPDYPSQGVAWVEIHFEIPYRTLYYEPTEPQ